MFVARIILRAAADECANDGDRLRLRGKMEGCPAVRVRQPNVTAFFDELEYQADVAVPRGIVQRGTSHLVEVRSALVRHNY